MKRWMINGRLTISMIAPMIGQATIKGDPMQLFLMKFTTPQVTEITGLPNDTIQNWIKRGSIIGHRPGAELGITGGGSQGRHRQFSFFAVMQFALTGALVKLGIGATEAAKMAEGFCHAGGDGEVFGLPYRDPGLPFHHNHGETLYAACGSQSAEAIWQGHLPSDKRTRDAMGDLSQRLGPMFVVVNVSKLFLQVCAGIARVTGNPRDFHPYKLLDEAYPDDAKG